MALSKKKVEQPLIGGLELNLEAKQYNKNVGVLTSKLYINQKNTKAFKEALGIITFNKGSLKI